MRKPTEDEKALPLNPWDVAEYGKRDTRLMCKHSKVIEPHDVGKAAVKAEYVYALITECRKLRRLLKEAKSGQ